MKINDIAEILVGNVGLESNTVELVQKMAQEIKDRRVAMASITRVLSNGCCDLSHDELVHKVLALQIGYDALLA